MFNVYIPIRDHLNILQFVEMIVYHLKCKHLNFFYNNVVIKMF